MNLTPVKLEFLLYCYYSGEKWNREISPAIKYAISEFLQHDIIIRDSRPSGFKVTEKGNFWVKEILKTPMPKAQWIIPGCEI